jgi:multiple sugar transport system permease protein
MKKFDNHAYLFVFPFFAVFLVFTAYPVVNTLLTSFTDESLTSLEIPAFVGFDNFGAEITSALFWKSFFNTWLIWLPNMVVQLGLALALAALLTNRELSLRGKELFRTIIFFPNIITITTVAILVTVLFDWQSGAVNQVLFGQDKAQYVNFFGQSWSIRAIISGVQTWMWFGYTAITLMAGIQAMPAETIEAATIDGASGWRIFTQIVLPFLRPILAYVLITSLIGGLQMFDLPWVMFPGGQGGSGQAGITMSVYMYARAFAWDQNLGAGSAVAWILFALTAGFSFLAVRGLYGRDDSAEGVQ